MNNGLHREHFICKCESVEHQLSFSYFEDEEEVYCSVHLAKRFFLERLVRGVKYIFGHRCRYGDFEEFIFKKEDADRLQKVVDKLRG